MIERDTPQIYIILYLYHLLDHFSDKMMADQRESFHTKCIPRINPRKKIKVVI